MTDLITLDGGGDVLGKFVASRMVATATERTYLNAMRQFWAYLRGRDVRSPTRDDVISFVRSLRTGGKAGATIRLYVTVLKLFFAWTARAGIYPDVAADVVIKLRKSTTHARRALTLCQARALLASNAGGATLADKRNRAIIALALSTGLRTVEISRADVADLSLGTDCYYLSVHGKGRTSKDDMVKVSTACAAIIYDYLDARAADSSDPMFASLSRNRARYGSRLSAQSVGKIIKRALLSIGLDAPRCITAHSLRHTAATLAITAGVDIREVSAMLRHASLVVTSVYLHDISLADRRAELTISAELFG